MARSPVELCSPPRDVTYPNYFSWGRDRLGPPPPPRGPGGGKGGRDELGRGHTNTRQSPNILDKSPTHSTKVAAKAD